MQTTVPCTFCGTPTTMTASKKCESCYEVVGRLSQFLRTEAGRDFVRDELANSERDAAETGAAATAAPRFSGADLCRCGHRNGLHLGPDGLGPCEHTTGDKLDPFCHCDAFVPARSSPTPSR